MEKGELLLDLTLLVKAYAREDIQYLIKMIMDCMYKLDNKRHMELQKTYIWYTNTYLVLKDNELYDIKSVEEVEDLFLDVMELIVKKIKEMNEND